ncbi:MAG: MATE family efflux transporter, partial [Planctomycetaceae bacterium]
GGLLLLASMLHPRSHLRLVAAELVPRGDVVRRILRIGLPAAGDGAILWSGHFLFLKIVGWMGEVPLATHMIGIRVEAITYLPAVAWGAAAATMVGQSLGNRDPDRARRAGHEAVRQCSLLGIVITLVFCLAPGAIFGEMHTDPAVVDMGARAFPIVALLQIPLMIGIIYAASLRGAGDTRFPLLMTAVSTYGVRLPVAWLLGIHFELGLLGAWIAMSCDMGLRAVLAALRFTGGRWSRTEV